MSTAPDPFATETQLGTLKTRSVRGAAATFAAQSVRFVLQFGSQLALARLLSPAEFGLLAMAGPVLSFVQVFNELGLSQATVQRPHITQAELSGLFWINMAISTALAVVTALCAPLVAAFYGEPRLVPICVCLGSLLIVSGLSAQQIALMNRTMRFGPLAVIDITCSAAAIAAGVVSALCGLGYWSLVVMQAVNSLTIAVLAWRFSSWRPSRPRRDAGVLSMLRFGSHLTIFNLVTFVGANLDGALIGRFNGRVELGLYDRAFKLVGAPLWQISLPIARIADSLLARLQGSPDNYRRAYLQMLELLLLATVPAVVLVAMSADTLVPLLLGARWLPAAPIVAWLALASAFAPLSISSYWLFVSQGRTGEQLRYVGVTTVLTVTALLIGLPWGAVGVARAYAAFALFTNGSMLWGATRRGPVDLASVAKACLPVALAAAAAAVAMRVCERHLAEAAAGVVTHMIGEGIVCYGAFAAVLLCHPRGQDLVRRLWILRLNFRSARITP